MNINIDVKKLDKIIAESQPKFAKSISAKPKTETMVKAAPLLQAKAVGFVDVPKIEGAILTFCGAWTKVNPLLNLGLKYASWFMPADSVALAKAVLKGMNEVIVPALCGPKQ